jgi:phage terminase large subunit
MTPWERYFLAGRRAGCPKDQMDNFIRAGVVLQPKQLKFAAYCRLCDQADGPTLISTGGGRGSAKTHAVYSQIFLDDCQRMPELKVLILRKIGKGNVEQFEEMRRKILGAGVNMRIPHNYQAHKQILTFDKTGSWARIGHYKDAKDIDQYMGLEYDVINLGEATQLPHEKVKLILSCLRTSKPNWRPRCYPDTNPGGVGHAWYKSIIIDPWRNNQEKDTRHVQVTIDDNVYVNPEYKAYLDSLTGWLRRAWRDGDWDIAAGQFFTPFRRDVHVIEDFDDTRAREWFAALDYGFAHYTVVLLGCTDGDGNVFIVDEHAERLWLPQRHAAAINAMLARHVVPVENRRFRAENKEMRPLALSDLKRFVAGADVFSRQSDGTTIAAQYAKLGINLRCANTDRVNGWAEILQGFGDVEANIRPTLFIHRRCARLVECLPSLQHDPNRPEDVLKVDTDEDGVGGDDPADTLRYMVATKSRSISQRKLTGL